MKNNFLALCLCVLLAGCTPGETPTPTYTPKPKELEKIQDLAYLPDDLREHTLDLYLPAGKEGPFPTLLMFHGGSGKKEDFAIWGNMFAKKGFAVISTNYRQWPDHQYPRNLEDAFCALSWVLQNSETYQFDPDNIYFLGHSAGGTLAASLGVVDDRALFTESCPKPIPGDFQAAGVITFTIIYDYQIAALLSTPIQDYTEDLMGGTYEELPEIWAQASPASWIDGSEPPFLLIHGGGDQSIPPTQSQEFADILKSAGVQAELLIIPDASHMQVKGSTQSMEAVESFLQGQAR